MVVNYFLLCPNEIYFHILSKLSSFDLVLTRLVSRQWLLLSDDVIKRCRIDTSETNILYYLIKSHKQNIIHTIFPKLSKQTQKCAVNFCAYCNNVETLNYLIDLGHSWNEETTGYAIDGCSLAGSHYDVLSWAKWKNFLSPFDEHFMTLVVSSGSIPLVNWAINNGYQIDQYACTFAIRNGKFELVKWIIENNYKYFGNIWEDAAQCGSFEIFKWLIQNNDSMYEQSRFDGVVSSYAASHDNFEMLKWLHQNGWDLDPMVCAYAARNGNQEMLEWAINNGCDVNENVYAYAAIGVVNRSLEIDIPHYGNELKPLIQHSSNQLNIIKWLHNKRYPWDHYLCTNAAKYGRFEILKWAQEHGCGWNEDTFEAAARYGDLTMLKWMKESGCPYDERVCTAAAIIGNLVMLKWARINDFNWNSMVTTYAAEYGNLEILVWAAVNGCPLDLNACVYAAMNGHHEILKWLVDNHYPFDWHIVLSIAVNNGHTHIVRWCAEQMDTKQWQNHPNISVCKRAYLDTFCCPLSKQMIKYIKSNYQTYKTFKKISKQLSY